MIPRGLFGSSARDIVPAIQPDDAPPVAPAASAAPAAAAAAPATRSFLGGLVKYTPVQGQTGADRMQIAGATLRDVAANLGGGQADALAQVQADYRARQEKAKKEGELQRLRDWAKELYPNDPEAQFIFSADPEKLIEQRSEAYAPQKPVVVNTRLGPRLYDPKTKQYEVLEDIPDKVPFGWTRGEDGELQVDPNFVAGQGQITNARAAATAAHRAPRRGGGGGGGSAPAPAKVPPWKRSW